MFVEEILDFKDAISEGEIADEQRRFGQWSVAYVSPSIPWPVRVQKVTYLENDFWIIPITNDAYPAVAVRKENASNEEHRELISRFLSVLSWVEGKGVLIDAFGGGNRFIPSFLKERDRRSALCDSLRLSYLPEISDSKGMLALALMREGRGLQHPAYSFLSFWRVLEAAIGQNKIKDWIRTAVDRISNNRAVKALEEIKAKGITDVAGHLYSSGRCAIAHASSDVIVDPDKPEDTRRLYQEGPLVETLAALAIEEKLGIKTSQTIFREHLYELAGFKKLLGVEFVQKITEPKKLPIDTEVNFPILDIGVSGRRFASFKCLELSDIRVDEGRVMLDLKESASQLHVLFTLNFDVERLEFEICNGLFAPVDDETPEYADMQADIQEFAKWYYSNGCLEIFDSGTGELIARKDEFMPVNVIVNPEGFDHKIEEFRSEARKRREKAG